MAHRDRCHERPGADELVQISDATSPDLVMRSKRRLGIRVSLASPFMRRFSGATAGGPGAILRVAAGVALAETTAREAGVRQAGNISGTLNELLATALSKE